MILKGPGIFIRVDKNKPTQATQQYLRQAVGFSGNRGEIPMAGNFFQGTIDVPCPAVKGAAEFMSPFAIVYFQHSAAMQAGIVKCLEFILIGAHNNIIKVRDLLDIIVTDFWNIILMTGHLPDSLPDLFDFKIVKFF